MIDSIYVGMTGLAGFSNGLHVIANNTANMNTTGFKSSTLQFADLFYTPSSVPSDPSAASYSQTGYGLNTAGTLLSFKQGDLQPTSNPLDLAINGQGFFLLRDADAKLTYTRAGQFRFGTDGVLRTADGAQTVMGLNGNGTLTEITIAGRNTNAGRTTSTVTFKGNLSSTSTTQTVGGVSVIDAVGGTHTLDVRLTSQAPGAPTTWTVEVLDGATVIGTGQIQFQNGLPLPGSSTVSVTYSPAGVTPIPLTLDFSTNVTSYAAGNLSTLTMDTQNGIAPGGLTDVSFNASGTMMLSYANGQTVNSTQLALMRFDLSTMGTIAPVGDNQFVSSAPAGWQIGAAGSSGFGTISSSNLERSNVDLTQEFSNLVIMQRGYQASSQVITTANDMIQQLFSLKSSK